MEKLDPATISVKIDTIGHIDDAAPDVIAKEQREEQDRQIEEMRKKEKKIAKKMRGRSSTANKQTASTRQQHEAIRANNKLAYLKENDRAKVEAKQIDQDVEFLTKHETKFDPISEMFDKTGNLKR
jgi:flagellar biosynthesis GTPase FlhF